MNKSDCLFSAYAVTACSDFSNNTKVYMLGSSDDAVSVVDYFGMDKVLSIDDIKEKGIIMVLKFLI